MGSNADERLARRAARGDRGALEEIFRRYHQDLYRYCLATVGNPDDAQEAVQNAMLKVVRALPGEEREIKLKPWLYRIARNEAVETLRRRRDSVELSQEQAGLTAEIAETADLRERLRSLLDDLEQLPERQRSGLVMRELAGLGFEEIAAAFETSPAVARQTVYEARLSLRQMEAGREMRCAEVMRELSDADGRVTRRREIRAHLRDCPDCRAFEQAIAERRNDFAAIAALPSAASAALLSGALGSGAGAGAGTAAGGIGASGASKAIAGSAVAKSVATAAVVATVGVGVADRSGVVNLPLPGSTKEKVAPAASPAGGTGVESGIEEAEPRSAVSDGGADGSAGAEGIAGAAPDQRAAAGSTPGDPSQQGSTAQGPTNGKAEGNSEPGRPTQLPEAASGGQQTAAERKSPQGNTSPGTPRRNSSPGTPRGNPSPGTPRGNSSPGGNRASATGKDPKPQLAPPGQEKTAPENQASPPAPTGHGKGKSGQMDEP